MRGRSKAGAANLAADLIRAGLSAGKTSGDLRAASADTVSTIDFTANCFGALASNSWWVRSAARTPGSDAAAAMRVALAIAGEASARNRIEDRLRSTMCAS